MHKGLAVVCAVVLWATGAQARIGDYPVHLAQSPLYRGITPESIGPGELEQFIYRSPRTGRPVMTVFVRKGRIIAQRLHANPQRMADADWLALLGDWLAEVGLDPPTRSRVLAVWNGMPAAGTVNTAYGDFSVTCLRGPAAVPLWSVQITESGSAWWLRGGHH